MTQTLDPEFVLSIARNALCGTSNFTYGNFSDRIIEALSKQGVIKLPSRPLGGHYSLRNVYNPNPGEIEHAIVQAFFFILQRGFIYPQPNDSGFPQMSTFYFTKQGLDWVKGADPGPEEGRGTLDTEIRLSGHSSGLGVWRDYCENRLKTSISTLRVCTLTGHLDYYGHGRSSNW